MNWVQLIVVFLAIGGPILGRIAQAVNDRAKARKLEQQRQRAIAEALRTGRVSAPSGPQPFDSTPATTPTQSQRERLAQRREELLARRRAQLQALKRKQLENRRQQEARLRAHRETTKAPHRTGASTRASRQTRHQQPIQTMVVDPDGPEIHRIDPVGHTHSRLSHIKPFEINESHLQAVEPTVHASKRVAHPVTEDDSPEIPRAVRHSFLDLPSKPRDWRKYLIARELLNPPIALRPPGNDAAGMF